MDTKTHYESLLASIYSWMLGDMDSRIAGCVDLLTGCSVHPMLSGNALDLGAGNGVYSLALAKMGFKVVAVDFSPRLLAELERRRAAWPIRTVEDDMRHVENYAELEPEVIVCGGDTLTHLESRDEAEAFLDSCIRVLSTGGSLMLSFRDYSTEPVGSRKIIPVKSDDSRILTCILDVEPHSVIVTDLLYEKTATGWEHRVSSYKKSRIIPADVRRWLQLNGVSLKYDVLSAGMLTMVGRKEKP